MNSIKVEKVFAQKAIDLLGKLNLRDKSKKPKADSKNLFIPVIKLNSDEKKKLEEELKKNKVKFSFAQSGFEEIKKNPRNLKEELKNKLTEKELRELITSFNSLGDTAVIEIPDSLKTKENLIGEALMKLNKGEITLPQSDLNHLKTLYDAELLELDGELGKIFKLLSETKLIDNSIIVITSDHGEEFGEHGVWGMHSYSLYDELIHVPLIVKIPNINQPKRISSLAEVVDIPKTIISLLNLKSPQKLDGINLMDIVDGKTSKTSVYSETFSHKQQMLDNIVKLPAFNNLNDIPQQMFDELSRQKQQKIKKQMVRNDNFKLIKNYDDTIELYNLKDDALEKNSLFGRGISEEKTLIDLLNNY